MSARLQRALAVLLALGLTAAVVAGGVVPLLLAFEARAERIASLQERLARFAKVAARAGAIQAELESAGSAERLRRASFAEPGAALAAAALQETLRERVTAAGGEITSVRVLPERKAGPFGVIGVETRLRLDVAGLRQLLHGLESDERVLRLARLLVRAKRHGAGLAQGPGSSRGTLDVQLDVLGFRHAPGPGGGSTP